MEAPDRTPPSDQVQRSATSLDSDSLAKTASLLEEARTLVLSARQHAADRNTEFMQRTSELESSVREVEEVLIRTEQQASRLTNLYVATYQLHASLELTDVRAAVADIAVNLLGAEAFTIWVRNEQGQLLRAPESSAPSGDVAPLEYVGGEPLVDAAIDIGKPQFGQLQDSRYVVAVPFSAHGEVVGVLGVQRFLSHKQAISEEDFELLDLMAAHAASALLAARIFSVSQRKLQTYEGLLGFLKREPR